MALGLHSWQYMRQRLIVGGIGWLVAASILVGRPARAMADATAPDFDPATSLTIHLQLPFLGYSSHTAAPSGLVSSPYGGFGIVHWGGSIGARFFRLFEAEVGVTSYDCHSGPTVVAGAGLSPSLLRAKPEGTHWNLRLPVLFNYRADTKVGDGGVCGDDHPTVQMRGYMFSTGLDATYWSQSALGFNMRLLGSVGGGDGEESGTFGHSIAWVDIGRITEVSFTIGLAFR